MSPGHWSPVQDPQAGVQSLVLGFQDSDDKLVLFQALGSWYTYHNDYAGKPVCWFIRWNGFQSPEPQTVHPRTFWGAPRQLLVSTLKIPREDNDPSRVSATRGRARAALGEVKTGCKLCKTLPRGQQRGWWGERFFLVGLASGHRAEEPDGLQSLGSQRVGHD